MNAYAHLTSASQKFQNRMASCQEAAVTVVLADDISAAVTASGRIVNTIPTSFLRVWKRKTPKTGADLKWAAEKTSAVQDFRGSSLAEALKGCELAEGELAAYLAYDRDVVKSPLSVL